MFHFDKVVHQQHQKKLELAVSQKNTNKEPKHTDLHGKEPKHVDPHGNQTKLPDPKGNQQPQKQPEHKEQPKHSDPHNNDPKHSDPHAQHDEDHKKPIHPEGDLKTGNI